ncbi:MAG TPA: NAD-binding protein [Thermoanaerobaculia bacterium]|nr:NAD-binding protein [Thermoanaerobaculia bacterium]
MRKPQKRLILLILVAPTVLVLVSGLLYMTGMRLLEGQPRGFWDSLSWAAETLTTTGYGADARWHHPVMVIFVAAVQFVGVFLVFMIFPLYLIPVLEERFQARLPRRLDKPLEGHVVVYRYGPAVESLLGELVAAGIESLLLEPDEGAARKLFEAGRRVLHLGLGEGGLAAANLAASRALIANGTDDENAAVILAARQTGFTGPVLAVVEEPFHRRPIMLAGATATFTPRHILGAALAARASAKIDPRVAGLHELGRRLEVVEMQIGPASPLVGETLESASVRTRTGVTVLGQWLGGKLVAPPTPSMRLEADGILVVIGPAASLDRLSALARGPVALRRKGPFLIAGYGEVGGKVAELLRDAGEEIRVIDRYASPGVDEVGSLLDPKLLDRLDVKNAQAVILALSSDSATLFATVILKDLAPEVPVIARVNEAENVERIRRAGAYFALSISQVSGQMLAGKLLGQEAVALDPRLEILKVPAAGWIGQRPGSIRQRTGCTVVAIERGDEVLVEFDPAFRFAQEDEIYVFGTTLDVRRFAERVG